jgi:hypothetical protein
VYDQHDLDLITLKLNTRPRKTLGYGTPAATLANAHRLNLPPSSSPGTPGRRTSEHAGDLRLHRDTEGKPSGKRDV